MNSSFNIKKPTQVDSKSLITKVLTCGDKGNRVVALISKVEGRYLIATFSLGQGGVS